MCFPCQPCLPASTCKPYVIVMSSQAEKELAMDIEAIYEDEDCGNWIEIFTSYAYF